jgi:ABC-2 type transport system permease protein
MNSFIQLSKISFKIIFRDQSGIFFTIVLPLALYIAASLLPIGQFFKQSVPYPHYLLPGIIAMQVMSGGIYGLAYWMVEAKAAGVLKRFMVTPINKVELILSLLSARVAVMIIQTIIFTLVGVLLFKAPFTGNVFSVLLFVILGGGVFLLIGLLISTLAKSYQAAAPITSAIGLTFVFLGNIFYPASSLPHALQVISNILPVTYLADALRYLFLNPFNFAAIQTDLAVLAVWFAALLLLTVWRFKFEE